MKKYGDLVRLVCTVHDEGNLYVHKSKMVEIIIACANAMSLQMPDWPIPLTVGIEVGTSWGTMLKVEVKGDRVIFKQLDRELGIDE